MLACNLYDPAYQRGTCKSGLSQPGLQGAKLELTKRLEAAQAEHAEVVEQRDSQLADVQKQLRSVTGERDDALSQVERGKQREQVLTILALGAHAWLLH